MTENEAIKVLKQPCNCNYDLSATVENCDISKCDKREATKMAIKALEKQIPKKPIKSKKQVVRYVNTYYCPTCELGITGTNIAKWCYHCGQKLDWSDEE